MPLRSAPSCRGAKDKFRKANALPVVLGVSALAHTAAIGTLLMLNPVRHFVPTVESIEISLVSEQAPGSPRANNLSGAIPGGSSVDFSAVPLLSLMGPDVTAAASSANWSPHVNAGYSFDVPALPTFRLPAGALGFDAFAAIATMLDCLAVGGSTREASGSSGRGHAPCASEDDPSVRARVVGLLPMDPSQPSAPSADIDYRTFKRQSVFYESVLPDEVPAANSAFKKSIVGLSR